MSEEMKNSTEQVITEQTTQAGSEPAVQPEVQGASESQSEPRSKKKQLALIIAAAVVLIALIAGISIYNTPENRLIRQLETANKYLEEGEYEEAALAFEEAIAIDDRCLEAYAGGIEAYLGAGDVSRAQDFFDRTLTMLSGLDADFANENMDSVVELYLAADEVYGDDLEKIAQVLEEGYTVTGEDSRVKDKLIENYLQTGKEETNNGSYEEALTVYDRLLELDSTKAETITDLCACLNHYIDVLMKEERYDEVRALAEKYGDVAADVDFAGILAQIAELERIEAENRAFMQKVYDLMAAEDYEGMCEVDGSEEADAFVERMEDDHYIYFPDSDDSAGGTGAGVYIFGEGGYYFYYGDYADGERKGNGTSFIKMDTGYDTFTGAWDKDVPNGEGTEIRIGGKGYNTGEHYDKVSNGMLIDGLWDGYVNSILTDNGDSFDLSFSAVKGIPTEDKTEEWRSAIGWYEYLEDGWYVYAFDYHQRTNNAWWSRASEGECIGIFGFADE